MAQQMRPEAHGEIDVAIAVEIDHMRALGGLDIDRVRHLDRARDLQRQNLRRTGGGLARAWGAGEQRIARRGNLVG
jgi:hypothetical protein